MAIRVLTVDDDPTVREMLELLLQLEGFDVRVAGGGAQAIADARSWIPDIILLDVMMPDADGFTVAHELKQDAATARIPLMFVSAKAGPEDVLSGWQHGAESYITKPFDTDDLVTEIRRVVAAHPVLPSLHSDHGVDNTEQHRGVT